MGDIIFGFTVKPPRLATVCLILAAGASLSACSGAAEAGRNAGRPSAFTSASAAASTVPSREPAVGGYEGLWNATPASGSNTEGLPQETVAINTRTNTVVDAFSRKINETGRPTLITDVPYTVVPDPSWPADSVIIIDTAANKVTESYRVDVNGSPIR